MVETKDLDTHPTLILARGHPKRKGGSAHTLQGTDEWNPLPPVTMFNLRMIIRSLSYASAT
eukprot:122834-Prymnesium_polylepis.1